MQPCATQCQKGLDLKGACFDQLQQIIYLYSCTKTKILHISNPKKSTTNEKDTNTKVTANKKFKFCKPKQKRLFALHIIKETEELKPLLMDH